MQRRPRAMKPTPDQPSATPDWPKRSKRNPEFDAAIGSHIRATRIASHMSQTALGEAVGISFQQIQKYELGKDRVSAGTLQDIARTLGVHPGSFFDDEAPAPSGTMAAAREASRIGTRVLAIKDPLIIRRVMAMVDELAKSGNALSADGAEKLT